MAKFTAMSVTTSVKQGLERGVQGVVQSAVFDIPKQLGTTFIVEKALGLRYLSGTGLVNPALSVNLNNVVSGLKESARRLIEGNETQNLASVGEVSGREDAPAAQEKPPKGTFVEKGPQGNTLYLAGSTAAATESPTEKGAFTQQQFLLKKDSTVRVTGATAVKTQAYLLSTKDQEDARKFNSPSPSPMISLGKVENNFSALRVDNKNSVLGTPDISSPAFILKYPDGTDAKSIRWTNPFFDHEGLKPKLPNNATFPYLRISKDLGLNSVTTRPSATSAIAMDTAAAMPTIKSGEFHERDVKDMKRTGAPALRQAVESRRIFTVADRSSSIDDPATRPDIPSMGVVKKNTLKGVNGFIIEEFVQTHRFYVADVTGDEQSVFEWEENSTPKTLAAGFSGCTAPRFEIESKEIKEGTWEFPRVFCKGANAQSITLSKGLVRAETGFYLWILNAMRGKLTRRTIEIVSYGRGGSLQSSKRLWLQPNQLRDVSVCVWTLYNCYPLGYRTGQDWDADSGKIQIAELDMHYEWFEESAGKLYKGVAIENA